MNKHNSSSENILSETELNARFVYPFFPLFLAAVALLAFIIAVHTYANRGEKFVTQLSNEIGEVVIRRARALEKSGQSETAIAVYRNALTVRFDDKQQRIWALRRFAHLLISEGQYDEAFSLLEECIAASPKDTVALSMLCQAYGHENKGKEQLRIAQQWLSISKGVPNLSNDQMNALFFIGNAYETMGDETQALNSYLEGAKLVPASLNSYHGARLLEKVGRNKEAENLLNAYMKSSEGKRNVSAAKLKKRLQNKL